MTLAPSIKWLNGTADTESLLVVDHENLSIYDVEKSVEGPSYQTVKLITSSFWSTPGTKIDHDSIRCFTLDHTPSNYFACGYSTGRITINKIDLDRTNYLSMRSMRVDEIRELQRCITSLCWSFSSTNKLCAVHERVGRGSENTLMVYDVSKPTSNYKEQSPSTFEASVNEKVNSISWFTDDPSTIASTCMKTIRLCDIREHNSFFATMHVQNPHFGVCSEPINGYRFACYSKSSISTFDRRYMTSEANPIYEIPLYPSTKNISNLTWHPTELFHMSCIVKDSGNFVHMKISPTAYDNQIPSMKSHGQELPGTMRSFFSTLDMSYEHTIDEYAYSPHFLSIPSVSKIISFDWNTTKRDSLAVLAHSNRQPIQTSKNIQIVKLRTDAGFSVNCDGDLAVHYQAALSVMSKKRNVTARCAEEIVDLSDIFKIRVRNNYGYGSTQNPVSSLVENSKRAIEMDSYANDDLKYFWRWAQKIAQFSDVADLQKSSLTNFIGIRHIVKGMKSSSTIKNDDITFRNRIFANDRRLKILKICNWPDYCDKDEWIQKFEDLMNTGKVENMARAAALAMFSIQGSLCRDYLTKLVEFTRTREFVDNNTDTFVTTWRTMSETVLKTLKNYDGMRIPDYDNVCSEVAESDYLLSILKFLARRERVYTAIHGEIIGLKGIEFEDKLAFSAIHMDDDVFNQALDKLIQELEQERPLTTLLITGIDDAQEVHSILQKYVENTRDLQTSAILLLMGNCFRRSKVLQDPTLIGTKFSDLISKILDAEPPKSIRRQSLHILRDYFDILNQWKFWIPKTFLSSLLKIRPIVSGEPDNLRSMTIQAVIACAFCGAPIYPSVSDKIEGLRPTATPKTSNTSQRRNITHRSRTISCTCRKPFPKCVICRQYFGTQAEIDLTNGAQSQENSATDNWFVWCCSCNHGGHMSHIRDWFREYSVCPSGQCDCQCVGRDQFLADEFISGAPKTS